MRPGRAVGGLPREQAVAQVLQPLLAALVRELFEAVERGAGGEDEEAPAGSPTFALTQSTMSVGVAPGVKTKTSLVAVVVAGSSGL